MRRSLAAALAVVVAAAGASGTAGSATTVVPRLIGIHAERFTAIVTWEVDGPARVRVLFGAEGTEPAVWSRLVVVRQAGRYTSVLAPLEPNAAYRARMVVEGGPRAGPAAPEASFRTTDYPTQVRARATPTGLRIDQWPFLARMVFRQCAWAFPASIAAGINVFMGTSCEQPAAAMAALAGKAFLVSDIATRADGPAVIGWHQLDEADMQADRPEALPLLSPSSQTGRTVFLTFSNHVWSGAAQLADARSRYPGFAARSEFIGADVYPLQSFCRKDWLHAVHQTQRELQRLAPGKPTFQWIEADPMGLCPGLDPSPALVRVETWLAFAGGARAIGWFPENWSPAVRTEITRLSRDLRSLAPALLSAERAVAVAPGSPVRAGGRALGGATYIIAANPSFERTNATFTVPGLRDGRLRIWGSRRTVPVVDGVFTDHLGPIETRVYVAPPPGFR